MNRFVLVLAAALILASVSRAAEKREIRLDTHQFQFSPEVVADKQNNTVRMAHSTLVADEMGATDLHQVETLSDRVWAKKVFRFDKDAARDARLLIYGKPKVVEVNEKPLDLESLASTGWTQAKVPPELEAGYFVWMRGGGRLLFEPGRVPQYRTQRDSYRSSDGGRSWTQDLGDRNPQPGEYLVRLRVRSYASDGWTRGWALSPVLDLWAENDGGIPLAGNVTVFRNMSDLDKGQPDGTYAIPQLRTGSTPSPDEKTWTAWRHLGEDLKPLGPEHRWAQLKFDFMCRTQATPSLPRTVTLRFEFQAGSAGGMKDTEVVPPKAQTIIGQTSVPFVYQSPSPRLKLLRERYKLDDVIAPGQTELEQLMLLRHWVRNQWHTAWQGGAASWMPPWDAHIILECKDQSDCLTMCTHYAAVFTQCCLALGWTARHCILDHHCVSEVFVNQHNKWVMMDAGNSKERADVGLHFERGGVPLSALELHLAYHRKKTDGITVHFTPKALAAKIAELCRPAPAEPARPARKAKKSLATGPRPDVIPVAELTQYPVCQIENYRRYAFPARNNYLDSLLPGELYQGWSAYFYDGYWWVGDSPDDPKLSPEYSKHLDPARPQDIDWSLNWTRIHLARTAKADELQVDLETLTPNFARFEMLADGKWKPTPARFTWPVKPGENALRVRSVNQFGRPGIDASVQVKRGG